MALGIVGIIYLTVGGMIVFGLGMVVLIISGKSIYHDFKARLFPKGAYVFMVNSNRQASQYYKQPEDGIFRIQNKTYITNPDKIMNLDEEMKRNVAGSIERRNKKIDNRIKVFQEKVEVALEQFRKLSDIPENSVQRGQLQSYILEMKNRIHLLEKSKQGKVEMYYHKRRPTFFYIEGDPVPKDFHEMYTEMDSITIDNVIARSMTKDPKAVRDMEKQLKTMKFLLILAIGAAAAAAIIAISIKTDVGTIAQSLGVALTI